MRKYSTSLKKKAMDGTTLRAKKTVKKEKSQSGKEVDKPKAKKQKQNGNAERLSWRDFRFSDEELAHLKKVKKRFDSLDEETQEVEFEKLSLDEMHYLLVSKLQEDQRKGKRLT